MMVDANEYTCGRCGAKFMAHPVPRIVERALKRGQLTLVFNAKCNHCGWIAPQKYHATQEV